MTKLMIGQRIYWVRSWNADGSKDRVEMIYKGRCRRADEGIVGHDVCVRPAHLGDGDYTCVVAPDTIEES
jgi:hypothetical protein